MSIRQFGKENSSLLFTIGAGVGVLSTAYLAARASFQAARIIDKHEEEHAPSSDRTTRTRDRTALVWRLYVPSGLSAVGTVACIAGAKRIDGVRVLAAQTAVSVSEQAYRQYRDQIVAEFGDRKDQTYLSKVAEAKVDVSPPSSTLVVGDGKVICCELWTMRYFESSMDELVKAVNQVNHKMLSSDIATLDDLYYILGLQSTMISGNCGWESTRLLDLEISTIMSPDQKPCLAFEYNYVKSF
jgi:Family of unknown function (DUF6353)